MVLVLPALVCLGARPAAQTVTAEYRLKAAFIYQFPQFVDWPSRVWSDAPQVELCVLKPSPFGGELDHLVQGESLRGRPLAVRQIAATDSIDSCHLLFLPARSEGAAAVLKAAAQRPILTVGDSERFLDQGGIIQLKIVDHRVRFEVNMPGAQRVGLRLSTQLLSLAQAVRGGPS